MPYQSEKQQDNSLEEEEKEKGEEGEGDVRDGLAHQPAHTILPWLVDKGVFSVFIFFKLFFQKYTAKIIISKNIPLAPGPWAPGYLAPSGRAPGAPIFFHLNIYYTIFLIFLYI